jgi:hypothetical protein
MIPLRTAAAIALIGFAQPLSAQTLESLRANQAVHGFRTESLYLDGSGRPMGARFVHTRTGFTLDLLRLETAPQAYTWVNTFLVSDMGEPHTQEHLLLGKGNVGRAVANLESFSLVNSSAFVTQRRTQYHFNSPAGTDVFFTVFEAQLNALLNPDYTDEEIRREVRNIGVAQDPDGTLRLEEKGTVYNEMVSSYERPLWRLFRTASQAVYGERHPLALSAGGWPSAIREMTPEHIRAFHRATHHLGNMGTIAALPRSESLAAVLARTDAILNQLYRPPPGGGSFPTEADLPAPQPLPPGEIRFDDYPHRNPAQPSPVRFAWGADRRLTVEDEILLGLFLANFAGDPTTNLYRIFIESQTKEIDLGARSVSAGASREQGHPVSVSMTDAVPSLATPERLAEARARIMAELQTIAGWADGSPELRAFNDRMRARVVELRREAANFAMNPPGFGQRNATERWMQHLHRLSTTPDFRKSVTVTPELDRIERLLAGSTNLWRSRLTEWALLGRTPYVIASRPSPELIERENRERTERLEAELEALKQRYGVSDAQEAIRRYAADYDAQTAELETLAAGTTGRFLENPPLSLDEQLDYREIRIGPNVPLVWSRFAGLPAVTAGVALRMDAVPDDELMYLALLPSLLTQVGVIRDGVAIPFTEMRNRLREEILALNASYSTNPHTGRVELMLRASGLDVAEAERALGWMSDVLYHPDWRPDNLARIRDVVDQGVSALRNTTTRAEETWVDDPANAFRYQTNRLYLAAASFQTRIHTAQRLRWQLRAAPAGEEDALDAALAALATRAAGLDRDALRELLRGAEAGATGLSPSAVSLLRDALRDLDLSIADVPDGSLQTDFAYLVETIRRDLRMPPAQALSTLHRVRERVLSAPSARGYLVSSPENGERIQPALGQVLARLRSDATPPTRRADNSVVLDRFRARTAEATPIVFVGLVNPNTQGGVFLNTAPLAGYRDRDNDALTNFLSAQLYSGGGAHSMFMKTWAAGLAYSNGLRNSPTTGLLTYYAERVPELPQTMRFVIDELRNSSHDPALTEYAIAMAFGGIRSAHLYEARGEAMANDIADGRGPDVVRGFLNSVLALRSDPALGSRLHERMESVYGRVLPGYGQTSSAVPGGVFFVIGPESQMRLYEEYLRTAESQAARLHRLYPRDFWLVD